jgi:hypothetical protein
MTTTATTPATAASTLTAAATKPVASALEEWQRQQAAKAATPTPSVYGQYTASAAQGLADAAAGKPSTALQAATQTSREALSRQANNERMTTASAVANQGQLGQGNAFGATQATESNIASQLAASRLAETQALASEQSSARNTLLTNAQTETQQNTTNQMTALQNLLMYGTAAQKLQAQTGIQGLSGTTPGANTDTINEAAYQEAINDPTYKAQHTAAEMANLTAEDQLRLAQIDQKGTNRNFIASSDDKRSVGYANSGAEDWQPGQKVTLDGKTMDFVGKTVIDTKSNTWSGSDYNIYRYTFRDPETQQTITKDEAWNTGSNSAWKGQ